MVLALFELITIRFSIKTAVAKLKPFYSVEFVMKVYLQPNPIGSKLGMYE